MVYVCMLGLLLELLDDFRVDGFSVLVEVVGCF